MIITTNIITQRVVTTDTAAIYDPRRDNWYRRVKIYTKSSIREADDLDDC